MSEFEGIKTDLIGRGETLAIRTVDLLVVAGPDAGARLRLAQGVARIGSAPASHLRLRDSTVSRVHCEIRVGPSGVRITDSGSTNGTLIDGVRIQDAELTHGATVEIGATRFRVALQDEAIYLPLSERDHFGDIVGSSVEMRRLYAILERVAPTDATVLIQGETGTGKELVARAIHDASARAHGPFVAVDCGALAPSLVESELFGHARGSFTGAVVERRGAFEEADGGTLFFDEIGELPLSLQPKLLRAIESREVRRLGVTTGRRVDVRVIAATNRPLAQAVNAGDFREDLYYRLAVVELDIPPLRARREDVALLARHFYRRFSGSDEIPPEIVSAVLGRSWPGNVRELRNFIERGVSLGTRAALDDIAPPGGGAPIDLSVPFKIARRAWTRDYVRAAMERAGGNVTRAAEIAGVSRRFLQRLIARLERAGADEDVDD
jgi:transcriptional regulator with GAF, ATPase, and Fis domain